MRILMFAPADRMHAVRPLEWLLDAGHEVTLVSRVRPDVEPRGNYRFRRYPWTVTSQWRRLLGARLGDALALCFLRSLVRVLVTDGPPDVVHVHWVDFRSYYLSLAKVRPLVLSVWGTDINQHAEGRGDPEHRSAVVTSLQHADLTIVDAPDMAVKCEALAGQPLETDLFHVGVDTELFRPGLDAARAQWRKRLAIPQDALVFLSNRTWLQRNQHHTLVQAFAHALPRLPVPACLVLKTLAPGHDNAYAQKVRDLVAQLDLQEHVRWVDHVSLQALPEVYGMADIVLNHPDMDTLPVTFMEAAACQRSVVSVDLPSYRGTFAERYFTLVPAGDVDHLAQAMVEEATQPTSEREARQVAARQAVVEQYDSRSNGAKLTAIYTRLITRAEESHA